MNICRLCKSSTEIFLDLGKVSLPEEFRTAQTRAAPLTKYELSLAYCKTCLHVQLGYKVPPDVIYKNASNYFYDYSVTVTGKTHWQALVIDTLPHLTHNDLIVDIGCNTGILLDLFGQTGKGVRVLGVDPASHLVVHAKAKGIPVIENYFTPLVAEQIFKKYGLAQLVTCTNVLDHVDDLGEFMQALVKILDTRGVFIVEVPYFYRMLTQLTHIPYHQQIDYMMLVPFMSFLRQFDLSLFDAEEMDIHGGSIRMYIGKGKIAATKRLAGQIQKEKKIYKDYAKKLLRFKSKVQKQRDTFRNFIQKAKVAKKTIAGIGASAKGITLLNYCGFGHEAIDFISEKSPLKIGRFTPSQIPIVSDDFLLKKDPDYAILLAWNFSKEITNHFLKQKQLKTQYILPIPKFTLLSLTGKKRKLASRAKR